MPGGGQDQQHRQFGDGLVQHIRSVGAENPGSGGESLVDAVVADAVTGEDSAGRQRGVEIAAVDERADDRMARTGSARGCGDFGFGRRSDDTPQGGRGEHCLRSAELGFGDDDD